MATADPLPMLLVALPAVIAACRAGGALVQRIGQPAVVGEMCVGIILGPSLLGWLWPSAQHWLLPPGVLPFTGMLGQLGLLVFMFLIGLELDLSSLRGNRRGAVAVSQASVALPMALGVGLALVMYGSFAPKGVDRLPFALFMGVAMSITAFPVLARILSERGLYATPTGALAMACAAIDDVTAWCLLSLVVALTVSSSILGAATTAGLTVVFAAVMIWGVRPLVARWAARSARASGSGERYESSVIVALFSAICLAGLATDRIGVHTVFGAFLLGTVMPRGSLSIERAASRLRSVAVPVLLPLFFVQTGLRTNLAGLTDASQWLWAGAVLAVASVGKWGGATLAARAVGQDWRAALTIGALMNSRGLTELIILNIGYELGVIGPDLFTILVVMALVTTALTGPALGLIRRSSTTSDQPAAARSLEKPVAQ